MPFKKNEVCSLPNVGFLPAFKRRSNHFSCLEFYTVLQFRHPHGICFLTLVLLLNAANLTALLLPEPLKPQASFRFLFASLGQVLSSCLNLVRCQMVVHIPNFFQTILNCSTIFINSTYPFQFYNRKKDFIALYHISPHFWFLTGKCCLREAVITISLDHRQQGCVRTFDFRCIGDVHPY